MNRSYAETVTNEEGSTIPTVNKLATPDIRTIIREEQNEKLADETDKRRRACNNILHGVANSTGSNKDHRRLRTRNQLQIHF